MEPIIAAKREEIQNTAARHGARNIRVFGSQVTGKASVGSDLDLLIDLEDGRSLLDIVAIKQDLENILGCEVDVVTERSLSPYLRESIMRQAVAL